MAKRTRLGLALFFNNSTNSGIVNYIYNIVAALHTLSDDEQPDILLLHDTNAPVEYIKSIGYKRISTKLFKKNPDSWFFHNFNILISKITGINLYIYINYFNKIDCFYPYFPFLNKEFGPFRNKIEWLVDFNNKLFPQHYENNAKFINNFQEDTVSKKTKIVLSSFTLKDELKLYYPNYQNDVRVLRFACSLPSLENMNISEILLKYNISNDYFISPNQFWEHKNQIIVLKAIQLLKNQNPTLKFKLLFTGSLDVNRGKGKYSETVMNYITENNLEDYVCFLGILDRKEQLLLMKHSLAIIQPSLYEGWSTLVEESKALNKLILISDIKVHREQLKDNGYFFNPTNEHQLSRLLIEVLEKKPILNSFDYFQNIIQFANDIKTVLLN